VANRASFEPAERVLELLSFDEGGFELTRNNSICPVWLAAIPLSNPGSLLCGK